MLFVFIGPEFDLLLVLKVLHLLLPLLSLLPRQSLLLLLLLYVKRLGLSPALLFNNF